MKILDVEQNTSEWLALRPNYCCASEAPIVMGEFKYGISRTDLLDIKLGRKTIPSDSDYFKEKLYARGHEAEALARERLSVIVLEAFKPAVCVNEVDGLPLLASLDGCSEDKETIWEHKLFNKVLAENIRNNVLEPHYYWQLEHQLLTSGSDTCIFQCSNGSSPLDKEDAFSLPLYFMHYQSVPERREKLILGWKLFMSDLAEHKIEAHKEPTQKPKLDMALSQLSYSVTDTNINSNIAELEKEVTELYFVETNKRLTSDLDFAGKELLIKNLKVFKTALESEAEKVLKEFEEYAKFTTKLESIYDMIKSIIRDGDKEVKSAKEIKKQAIFDNYKAELIHDLESMMQEIDSISNDFLDSRFIINTRDIDDTFKDAAKGKKKIDSIESSVEAAMKNYQLEQNQRFRLALANFKNNQKFIMNSQLLFKDMNEHILSNTPSFNDMVQFRLDSIKQRNEPEPEPELEHTYEYVSAVEDNFDGTDGLKTFHVSVEWEGYMKGTATFAIRAKDKTDAEDYYFMDGQSIARYTMQDKTTRKVISIDEPKEIIG